MTPIEFIVLDLLWRDPEGLSWYTLENRSVRHPAFVDFKAGTAYRALRVLRDVGMVRTKEGESGSYPKKILTAVGVEALMGERIRRDLTPFPLTVRKEKL